MRSSFYPSAAIQHDEPIASINITPLIDVLLVLLIMFILTIPPMMNQIPIDLPQASPDKSLPITQHRLTITAGGVVSLNGQAADGEALTARLAPIRADRQASLVIASDGEARYDRFVDTLAIVKRAGITRLGFEGNQRFAGY
jgi:biopolymer transport protein ExbD